MTVISLPTLFVISEESLNEDQIKDLEKSFGIIKDKITYLPDFNIELQNEILNINPAAPSAKVRSLAVSALEYSRMFSAYRASYIYVKINHGFDIFASVTACDMGISAITSVAHDDGSHARWREIF